MRKALLGISSQGNLLSKLILILSLIAIIGIGIGCGGNGGDSSTAVQQGQFIDSPVQGLSFHTPTHAGVTNEKGVFYYSDQETITFYIGSIKLGSAKAKAIITPLDLVSGAQDEMNPFVTNICRFLLTLDDDADPENGTFINARVRAAAKNYTINFWVGIDVFESDADVLQAIAALTALTKSGPRGLIDVVTARAHLRNTLAGFYNHAVVNSTNTLNRANTAAKKPNKYQNKPSDKDDDDSAKDSNSDDHEDGSSGNYDSDDESSDSNSPNDQNNDDNDDSSDIPDASVNGLLQVLLQSTPTDCLEVKNYRASLLSKFTHYARLALSEDLISPLNLFTGAPDLPKIDDPIGKYLAGLLEIGKIIFQNSTPVTFLEMAQNQCDGVTEIWLDVREITACGTPGGCRTVGGATRINLLDPNGSVFELAKFSFPEGRIKQLRLKLGDQNEVLAGGEYHPLKIPSGQQSGLKLLGNWPIVSDNTTRITVRFNPAKSVKYNKGQGFILKPVIKVIDVDADYLAATGSIRINNDASFTESQNVTLDLDPDNTPDQMQFSNDCVNWSEWEPFQSTRHWHIFPNTEGKKTVYVRYRAGGVVSAPESDSILLLPKYGAVYQADDLPASLDKGVSQLVRVNITNTGFLTWDSDHPQFPVQLTYRFTDSAGNGIESYGNYGILPTPVAYGETVTVPILVRAPMQPGDYQLVFDLEEWGVIKFTEAGVAPLTHAITVIDADLPERPTVNAQEMPFGVGGFTDLPQALPSVATICMPSENLYRLNDAGDAFIIVYSVPYGRSIHNIYKVVQDTVNQNVFYEVDYAEYTGDTQRLWLLRDSTVDFELCDEELVQFPESRQCEDAYYDVTGVTDESCLDIAKATANGWIHGYDETPDTLGRLPFKPQNGITRFEFAKIIVNALELDLLEIPASGFFNDIEVYDADGNKHWYADYAYTAYQNNIMYIYDNGDFGGEAQVSFLEAVQTTMRMFYFDVSNPCEYEVLYPGDESLNAALFYGVIELDRIPDEPDKVAVTREYFVHIMVNAHSQQDNLSGDSLLCPNMESVTATPGTIQKQICGVDAPVMLSSGADLSQDMGILFNGTVVKVTDNRNAAAQIQIVTSGETGYVNASDLVDLCNVITPPGDNQVAVNTPIGIYAHIAPSPITDYVDFNGDGNGNNMDVIPYGSILDVLETRGNWMRVNFSGADGAPKSGWIFDGFVDPGADIPPEQRIPKQCATVSWAHGMTVDLRRAPDFNKDSIVWELYEDARVQLIAKHDSLPFYYVKIDSVATALSSENLNVNYARLYNLDDLALLNDYQRGVAGWIHAEFLKVDGVSYATPFGYPFDYELLDNHNLTTDLLVTQIFMEEVFGNIHNGIDYQIIKSMPILAAADGVVKEVHFAQKGDLKGLGNYVVIEHQRLNKFTTYGHLETINVSSGEEVKQGEKIGTTGGDGLFDAGSGKPHLHFMISNTEKIHNNLISYFNPSKWLDLYNNQDGHSCVRNIVVYQAIRNEKKILENCDIAVGKDLFCPAQMEIVFPYYSFECEPDWNIVFFDDDIESNEYYNDIVFAKEQDWINGYFNEKQLTDPKTGTEYPVPIFKPSENVNRAEAIKIILNATLNLEERDKLKLCASSSNDPNLPKPELNGRTCSEYGIEQWEYNECFPDVPLNSWYAPYACYAKKKGIIHGYPDGTFGPSNPITFAEILKIGLNAFDIPVFEGDPCKPEMWYEPFMKIAESYRIEPMLDPDTLVKRDFMVHLMVQCYDIKHRNFDDNDNLNDAPPMFINSSLLAGLENNDKDYFKIDIPSSGRLMVYTTGNTDTYGDLYVQYRSCQYIDENCIKIIGSDDKSDLETNFAISHSVDKGTYYIVVSSIYLLNSGHYNLHAKFYPKTQKPADYLPNRFGYKYLNHAKYSSWLYHPGTDLNIENQENGEQPVFAIADGVIKSNVRFWGGIVVRHNFGGRIYHSQYGHIFHIKDQNNLKVDRSDLLVCSSVNVGKQIAKVGNVGDNQPYHLHFEIRSPHHPHADNPYDQNFRYNYSNLGNRKSVFIRYEAPLSFIESYSDPSKTIIVIDDSTTYDQIENDIIDNIVQIDVNNDGKKEVIKERFFKPWGEMEEWNQFESGRDERIRQGENRGFEGNYHSAYVSADKDKPTAAGKWFFDIPETGDYEVFVSVAARPASSKPGSEYDKNLKRTKKATYNIYHNVKLDTREIDQSLVTGSLEERWVSLGTYSFKKGNNHHVSLGNNTGENEEDVLILFDAIKLVKSDS